ncbi:MAG: FGGY-family carbohydrate kinase [Dehalococcoidia bacterium]
MAAPETGPLYLAIDFGTSHIRAAVGPATGTPLAVARRPIRYRRPDGTPDAALEFDPQTAWRIVCETVHEALAASGTDPKTIKGAGVTSQRLGLVLYDKDGRPLYAGPNRDLRAIFEGGEIDADYGNTVWQMTGHGPGFLLSWARFLWFKRNAPEMYDRIRTASTLADWLAFRMTGVLLMEATLGVESGLALVATGHPAGGLGEMLDLDEIDLAPTCPPGTVVGSLTKQAAKELGLRTGTPVVAAGPDTQAGLLGLGATEPDQAGVIAGWSAAVQRVTNIPFFDDTHSMWTGRHIVPDRWVLEGNAGEMGGAYEWLTALVQSWEAPARSMERLDMLASAEPIGARGTSAYLGPTFINMADVGLRTGGLVFPSPLAFEPPTRGSLARATLESFAFAIRFNLDRLALFGGPVKQVAVGGGMVRTRTFNHVLAAVVGHSITIASSGESTALGVLSMAGVATDRDTTMEQVTRLRRSELVSVEPKSSDAAEYHDLYHAWRMRERQLGQIDL